MTEELDRESERRFSDWMAQPAPTDLHDAHAQAWFGMVFKAWEAADGPQTEIEKLKAELKSECCNHDSDRRARIDLRIKEKNLEYAALVTTAKDLQMNVTDAPALTATPARVVAVSKGTPKPQSNKSEKTLIFEAKVLELMGNQGRIVQAGLRRNTAYRSSR